MTEQNKSLNRCSICNIKVKMDGWNCKCNELFIFCNKHRLPFEHNCTYNHKKEYTDKLKIINIKCKKEKLEPF